jgi:predicted flavoprotein YhiN
MSPDVVVVGAGAAGIFAAWKAASEGAKVVLLEKTSRIGTKILISGGGKCNICHDGPIEEVLKAFRPNEGRFIRPSVYRFPNHVIVEMLTSRGLRVYTRPDGRIFPVDQTAKDVVAILRGYLDEAGVKVYLNTPVEELLTQDGEVVGVRTGPAYEANKGYRTPDKTMYGAKGLLSAVLAESDDALGLNERTIECERVILAAGGSSYPNSGTTGDGWVWAKQLGHKIEKITAALAPVYLELDPFDPAKSGVALRGVVLKARQDGKEIARWRNDMLFTHQGVSGPTVLGISRIVAERIGSGEIQLQVDLLPDETQEVISAKLIAQSPKRMVASFVSEVVPESLVSDLLNITGIPSDTSFAKLERKARNRLVELIKAWPIGKVRAVPLEKGEVVAGGVSLEEVDPKTMKSRLVAGLYLCGEVLDVAGPVGGYNLQAAFATGFVAGESAAQKL